MGIVTLPGDHNYADPNPAYGAGETSIQSPLRNSLDSYQSALADTAKSNGGPIGSALLRISKMLGLSRLGDLLDGTDDDQFDAAAAVRNFFTTLLKPQSWFQNVGNIFGIVDLDDDGLDIGDVWHTIVTARIDPLNLFAKLVGGFIPGFQIPGLDASKIISGLFPRTMVDGLGDLITGVVSGTASTIGGAIGGFINAILGFGQQPIRAYTTSNPVVAALTGRVAAIEASNTAGLVGFSDHFNDATLGGNWVAVVGTLTVVNGAVYNDLHFAAARYGAETLATNRWHVQATNVIPSGGGFGGQHRIFGGANATLSNMYAAAEVDRQNPDTINLVTLTGPSAGRVLRDSFAVGRALTAIDVVALEFDPNLYGAGSGGYAAFLNSDLVCDWPAAPSGFRECGLQLNVQNSFFAGYGWDDFSAFDY